MEYFIFYSLALAAITTAVMVVAQKRAVYSALSLILCLASLAGLFLQLGFQFIAAIQVIVYAGAIMVLFVFVIMLIDPESELFPGTGLRHVSFWAVPLAILFVFLMIQAFPDFLGLGSAAARVPAPKGGIEDVGRALFSDYVLPFEATSILILVAILGAVVLAKRSD